MINAFDKLKNCQRSMKKYFKAVQIISIRAEFFFLFSKEMTECKEWKKLLPLLHVLNWQTLDKASTEV